MPEIPAPVHGEGLSKVGPLPTDEEDVVYLAAWVAWRDGDVMHALSRYRLDAGGLLDRSRLVAAVPSRFFFSGRHNGCFVHRLSGRGAADTHAMAPLRGDADVGSQWQTLEAEDTARLTSLAGMSGLWHACDGSATR